MLQMKFMLLRNPGIKTNLIYYKDFKTWNPLANGFEPQLSFTQDSERETARKREKDR